MNLEGKEFNYKGKKVFVGEKDIHYTQPSFLEAPIYNVKMVKDDCYEFVEIPENELIDMYNERI